MEGQMFIQVFSKECAERLSVMGMKLMHTDGHSWTFLNTGAVVNFDRSQYRYTDKISI
jgi:hypothetical protein